ncbi:MAG: NAD(P)H-dependent oxidoreductase [Verrucomicrobiota bacterium]
MMNETILNALNWRYACKQFDSDRKISESDWSTLEDALILTPSSFGMQPWKFLVVQDQAVKDSLVEHSWGQRQVADCSHLLILTIRTEVSEADVDKFVNATCEARGEDFSSMEALRGMMAGFVNRLSPEDTYAWAKLQSYIALGNFMTSAALLEIDTCPMEGFLAPKYDQVLGLKDRGLTCAVICPAGYRSAEDKYASAKKVRYSREELIEYI